MLAQRCMIHKDVKTYAQKRIMITKSGARLSPIKKKLANVDLNCVSTISKKHSAEDNLFFVTTSPCHHVFITGLKKG